MKTNFKQMHALKANSSVIWQNYELNCRKTNFKYKTILIALILTLIFQTLNAQNSKFWLTAGQNRDNTRNASAENQISPETAGTLVVKWVFTTGGDVSANPAVDNKYVYFPDWAGNLYKLDANTGAQVWKKEIKSYTGQTFGLARATPAIARDTLIIGTQVGNPAIGARVLAINKQTGNLLWSTKVDDHPASSITQSAIVFAGRVYVGVSSSEEGLATDPNYPCCSFRGSMLCLDEKTGQILWKTYIVPEGKGFSGGAVWGSTPVIDPKRNSVYITTGNNYTVRQAILDCVAAGGSPEEVKACIAKVDGSAENYFDAVMALDLNTGAIKWAKPVLPFDAWTVACLFGGPNCPENAGPDYDFGQGPALFTIGKGANKRELLGAGQKSGIYWAFNPDNGNEIWHTQVGPGSTLGGLEWGSAVDGKQIYGAIGNHNYIPHTMTKGPGAGRTVRGGFWASLDAATGSLIWENAGSNPPIEEVTLPFDSVASNTGMVTVANGVVFAGALDAVGTMYAFDAATGEKLWSFESGGSINSGAAVVDGNVYWGSGYANVGGSPNNKFYAFHLGTGSAISAGNDMLAKAYGLNGPILVYPNPAKDEIKIVSKDKSNIRLIQLFDLAGRLIKDFKPSAATEYKLNVASIPAGAYLIHITTTTNNISAKIVVTH